MRSAEEGKRYYKQPYRCVFDLKDQFKCADGQYCVPARWRCNERKDCNDASDEMDCPSRIIKSYVTYCALQKSIARRRMLVVVMCRRSIAWVRRNVYRRIGCVMVLRTVGMAGTRR